MTARYEHTTDGPARGHLRLLQLYPRDMNIYGDWGNTLVLARRAQVLVEDDDEATQTQVEILDQLSHVCLELSEVYDVNSRVAQAKVIPDCVNELRMVAQRAGMDIVPENAVLSAYAILAQTRSLIVDLLMVCGMSRESALAALVPTSTTPKYEPETFDFE